MKLKVLPRTADVPHMKRCTSRSMPRIMTGTLLSLMLFLTLTEVTVGGARADVRPAGFFVSHCNFNRRLADDPVVAPRKRGASHNHDFFGNTSTDALSTLRSLSQAGSSCVRKADRAAYWTPALMHKGSYIEPANLRAYYRVFGSRETVHPLPPGLRMIAGDAKAKTVQPPHITNWQCHGSNRHAAPADPGPTCQPGEALQLKVNFPNCWDGRRLDSRDHKSHMAYEVGGRCPTTHPVNVARLSVEVTYRSHGSTGLGLASGGAWTAHADFINTWDTYTQRALVEWCMRGGRACDENPSRAPLQPPARAYRMRHPMNCILDARA